MGLIVMYGIYDAWGAGAIIIGGGVVKHHIMNANLMRNGCDHAVLINTGQVRVEGLADSGGYGGRWWGGGRRREGTSERAGVDKETYAVSVWMSAQAMLSCSCCALSLYTCIFL